MRNVARMGAFVLLVGQVGCGGGGGSQPAAPATAAAFCQQAETLSTDRIIRCYGGTAADWPVLLGVSTCDKVDQAVADHKMAYDASKAAACLADLAKPIACASVWPDSCVSTVLVGAVADGQPCDTRYICGQHSTCTVPSVSDTCAAPICQHVPTKGEPCDYSCQAGSQCVNGTCLANLKSGATCGMDVPAFCDDQLYCPTTGSASCKPRIVEGGACDDSSGCWDHQYCDSTKHCRYRLAVGGDCSDDVTSCQAFTVCDPSTQKCVAAGHDGQLCSNVLGFPNVLCVVGVGCVYDANQVGHCVNPVADGAACAQGYECLSGACSNGVCAAVTPNDGAACAQPEDCTSGICTVAGICAAPAADGANCTGDELCQSGWCSGGKCTPRADDGVACLDGTGCLSGHCAAGKCAACP